MRKPFEPHDIRTCPTCNPYRHTERSPWFLMFVAALLLAAVLACMKITEKTNDTIREGYHALS